MNKERDIVKFDLLGDYFVINIIFFIASSITRFV